MDELLSIYISGYYTGTIDFDPSEDEYNLSTSQSMFFVAKYDSTGNFKWAQNICMKKDNWGLVRSRMFSDRNSNIYLSTPDTLSKINQFGNILWSYTTNGFAVFDERSALYLLSNSLTPWDTETCNELYITKISTSGQEIYSKQIITNTSESVNGFITYDKSDNLLVNGDYWDECTFNDSINPVTFTNFRTENTPMGEQPSYNEYFSKFDTLGNLVWVYDFGENSPNPYIIETTTEGDIFTLGSFYHTVGFSPTNNLSYSFTSEWGEYIAKYNSTCDFLAATDFLGGSYIDLIGDFKLVNDSTAYICGKFMNFIDLDLTSDVFELSSYDPQWMGMDIFIAKYTDFNISDYTSNMVENGSKSSLLIYPNPTVGLINIENNFSDKIQEIQVYDFRGSKIRSLSNTQGTKLQVDISNLSKGQYYLKIILKNRIVHRKIIFM